MPPVSVRRPAAICLARRQRATLAAAVLSSLLVACGHAPTRPQARDGGGVPHIARGNAPSTPAARGDAVVGNDPCAPTRVHRDSDYTPGGLYAPGVADGGPTGPIDVSRLQEPVPRPEPRARSGNRSPYTVLGKVYRVLDDSRGYHERGVASWYGTKFNGRATSSGELYDICSFTAAHKTLPLPSYVRVTNLDNGRSLVVRVNDRGPFHDGRVMDLSYAAAVRLGVDRTGTARVDLEAIDPDGRLQPPAMRTAHAAPSRDDAAGAVVAALPDEGMASTSALAALDATEPPVARPWNDSPAALPSAVGRGEAFVQVGSFGEQANARRVADRLDAAGIGGASIDHAGSEGREVWRVRIGPVPDDATGALLERLRDIGLPGARVLRR